MAIGFPAGVKIRSETWQVVQQVRSSGPSLAGQVQRIQAAGLPWQAVIEVIIPNGAIRAMRNWLMIQRGGIYPVRLSPTFHRSVNLQNFAEDGGFTDSTMFSDGTPFMEDLDPPVPVSVVGAHAAGATVLTVMRFGEADDFEVGTYIGLGGRLHQVVSVAAGDPVYANVALGIWPPLRASAADGDPLQDPPRTKMSLSDPDAAWMPDLVVGDVARLRLTFIENLGSVEAVG